MYLFTLIIHKAFLTNGEVTMLTYPAMEYKGLWFIT